MCYYKSNAQQVEEIESRYKAKFKDPTLHKARFRENGFQFPKCALILQENPQIIDHYRWGLIPSWIRSAEEAKEIRLKTLNARAESIFEKPSFRQSIQSKRCLVVSTGYFEWQHEGKKKIPHYISLNDAPLFSMGGIYESWINPANGEKINSFSIITTVANPMTAKIHNSKERMPLILEKEDEEKWLDPKLALEELEKLMRPFPEQQMQAWKISEQQFKEDNDQNPKLIEEWIDPNSFQGSLF
ncbi:MAG: SOS response-associated peptidase [Flavobacteriales bacterium]|nr:SOS response-associated peptidase [Flavobacteriales bacterium]